MIPPPASKKTARETHVTGPFLIGLFLDVENSLENEWGLGPPIEFFFTLGRLEKQLQPEYT